MKASVLLNIIKNELKDYPIEYLRNKVTDDRYKDPLVKKLAKYNSETYDEIYSLEINDDFDIKDSVTAAVSDNTAIITTRAAHRFANTAICNVYTVL